MYNAHFYHILQKVEILVSDKNKMSTNRAEFVLFDWLQVAGTHAHNILTLKGWKIRSDQDKVGNEPPSQLKTNSKKFVQIINNIINFQP